MILFLMSNGLEDEVDVGFNDIVLPFWSLRHFKKAKTLTTSVIAVQALTILNCTNLSSTCNQ